MDIAIEAELRVLIDMALRGELDEDSVACVHELGAQATNALMLAVNAHVLEQHRRIAEMTAPGPHTPSGSIPVYAKPHAKRRRKKPGARVGHAGHRRPAPDERVEVAELTKCPECDGRVLPARRRRTIEDMPDSARVKATEYSIPNHWRPCCRKHVEPRVGAALPKCAIGNNLAAMAVTFHYGLGLTLDQTRVVLLSPLQTRVSAGGLADLWRRVAEVLVPWYERIGREARASATLHADETGWRVNGRTHWLWYFCNHKNCYYMIDAGRGGAALKSFFTEAFEGVLIHDFWRPYGSVLLEGTGDHQCCLVHLLRELDHVSEKVLPRKIHDAAEEWLVLVKMLRRLIRDGIRLRRRDDFTPEKYRSRIVRIDERLRALCEQKYADDDASRPASRPVRHQDELFTFLDRPESDWNHNLAERMIRPAVILRKNSQCNRSKRGTATQAVLMTIYRTLRLHGHDPRQANAGALDAYAATGSLPRLPSAVADG